MPVLPDSQTTLRPLATRLAGEIPSFVVTVANSFAVRGRTAKGDYESRVFLKNGEIRTTFLRKGGNPLQDMRLLCRTSVETAEGGLTDHIGAITANEAKLPWVRKEADPETGNETVTILPFGDTAPAPRVVARTSALTGMVSMEVCDAREMSPAEARLLAESLIRAADIAAAS